MEIVAIDALFDFLSFMGYDGNDKYMIKLKYTTYKFCFCRVGGKHDKKVWSRKHTRSDKNPL